MRILYKVGKNYAILEDAQLVAILRRRYDTGKWIELWSRQDLEYLQGLYDAGMTAIKPLLDQYAKTGGLEFKIEE